MTLLDGKSYNPATAVTKSCGAALAMTALDTTNLRLTFTPPSSSVEVHLAGLVKPGGSTPFFPSVLFGMLAGTTVVRSFAPMGGIQGTVGSTATFMPLDATFVVNGLTAGTALTWDAAYGIELGVSGALLGYGGPNDATAGNAWGAFVFEVWDTL